MASPNLISDALKDETYCRPSEWTDIAKFYLLNYFLHTLTVIGEPGDDIWNSILTASAALFMPYTGIYRAFYAILRAARFAGNPLQQAARAGALCMVVRSEDAGGFEEITPGYGMTSVHGQLPMQFANPRNHGQDEIPPYRLVRVPLNYRVETLKSGSTELQLACNYSPLKALAALGQIVSGLLELYHSRGTQLQKYGYAAYSLTLTPYILMSFLNLLAAICQPQYPSMLIVYPGLAEDMVLEAGVGGSEQAGATVPAVLESQISGAVGKAYRCTESDPSSLSTLVEGFIEFINETSGTYTVMSLDNSSTASSSPVPVFLGERIRYFLPRPFLLLLYARNLKGGQALRAQCVLLLSFTLYIFIITAPYLILWILTGFKKGESTTSQRAWTMTWLVLSQIASITLFQTQAFNLTYNTELWRRARKGTVEAAFTLVRSIYFMLIAFVESVGGAVVVGQMMKEDKICIKL